MPVPGKCPDELRRHAIRLVLGVPWPIRIGLGVFQARRRRGLGVNPGTLRGWVRQARIDAGEGPGTTRCGGPEPPGAGEGGPGAWGRGARAVGARRLFSRQSVSAHRADLRLHRCPERGSWGPAPGLHRPDPVGLHDRPRPLDSRRPVPSSKRSVSDAAVEAGGASP